MFLRWNASKRRIKEAENARKNRLEIVQALSQGTITRRELVKMGIFTAGGVLTLKNGLSPFARSAYASEGIPTGTPPSPIPPGIEFTQPLPRLTEFERKAVSSLSPFPTRESNQTFNAAKGIGPMEGRPPGPLWAHQRWEEFFPKVAFETSTMPILPGHSFHPALPAIQPDRFWTFDGTPFKLLKLRYGEPVLFRHWNRLPANPALNGGFGRNSLTTHLHNGHTPAESDGFAGAFFFSDQFYDYRWPMALAGYDTINTHSTDRKAGCPDDLGGIMRIPGDWRETMSTLWFHDHMIDFTSQNVYKGSVAMANFYSAIDRGNEEIQDGVNLRLPSGTGASWGNTDYDINLIVSDKALNQNGQLFFDIFDRDGFLGDFITVNGKYKPFLEVERRKYRFRILNANASRYLKLGLSDGNTFQIICADGNLLSVPLTVAELPPIGIAERYDIVIDFSRYAIGQKITLVNLLEHEDGRGPQRRVSLGEALSGASLDPCVGSFLEFRIARNPAMPDKSRVPRKLVELTELVPAVRQRRFTFGRSDNTDENPWTIRVEDGNGLPADLRRISAAPKRGTAEIWHLKNGGGGWDHPIHVHFEEGRTLMRDGATPPDWERYGRKDVWRLGENGEVTVYLKFREFAGTFMEHCHNTVHEDHAMLLRWDLYDGPTPLPTPIPTAAGVTFVEPDILPEGV